MSYSTPGHPELDSLDKLVSRYVDAKSIPWVDLPFPGVEGKILLRDDQGVRTALARMAPGGEIPHHEHTGLEQTYVLEGSFEDHDGVCGAGEYVWRLAGNRHVARSKNGCLMLVFFESPNIYLSGDLEGMTMEAYMAQNAAAQA
jgi:anti-sigma factor ChrR (cupin superfamily)